MPFVLDASTTLAWVLPDESDDHLRGLLDQLADDWAVVPGVWALEVGNTLLVALRKGRLTGDEVGVISGAVLELPIVADPTTAEECLGEVLALGNRHGLSTYDASYLALALRRGLPLATADRRLRVAAGEAGVPTL